MVDEEVRTRLTEKEMYLRRWRVLQTPAAATNAFLKKYFVEDTS